MPKAKPLKILIIDDDELDRDLYKRYLLEVSNRAYTFAEESTAAAGIARLTTFEADCILLDFDLPDMSGLELLALTGTGADRLPAPIVMLTAIRDERVAVEAMKSGVMDYLPKGVNAAGMLPHAIDNAIHKFRMQRALEEQQAQIEASERRHRGLIEAIPHIVWTVTPSGEIDYANSKWSQTLGVNPVHFGVAGWLSVVHPEDRDRFAECWTEGLASRLPFQIEHRLKQAQDNSYHWYLSRMVPVFDEAGAVAKWFGTSTDIEDQKRAEIAVLSKQKLESLGLLAGGIAHDFNNLLVGILGGASIAVEELPESHPLQQTMRAIMRSGERAAHLTRQMLAYAGKGRFFVEAIDLNELIVSTCDLIKASIPKQVGIQFALQDYLPQIEGDSGQMQQIIMNLILNAVEAVDDKFHKERISSSADLMVHVATEVRTLDQDSIGTLELVSGTLEPGEHVVFEVRDTGVGMTGETINRIFDPFFTTKFTGRGLGLSAVQGILRSQKGAIEIQSAPGEGSLFRVFLPASIRRAAAPETPAQSETPGYETILVVDDEDMVCGVARASLERSGYRVITAHNGNEAIATLLTEVSPISLVILDMSMPGMSGKQVLQQIRQLNIDVPVVICSGYSEGEAHREFNGLDIAGFVQKPFSARQLSAHVSKALHPEPAMGKATVAADRSPL